MRSFWSARVEGHVTAFPLLVYSPHSKKQLLSSCPNSPTELNASAVGPLCTRFWTCSISFTFFPCLKLLCSVLFQVQSHLPINYDCSVCCPWQIGVWIGTPLHILFLVQTSIGEEETRSRQPSRLPSAFRGVMVRWFMFGFRCVSASPPPGHTSGLQANTSRPKHFLLVIQPPRRAKGKEKESKRVDCGKQERK